MAKKQPLIIKAPERPAPPAAAPAPPIYELSTIVLDAAPTSAALPPEAVGLSDQLRELAVRVIGTRRRIGEALLDACRYMSEARAVAEEGQWYIFLRVTDTSPDSAETLLNIHYRVGQHPAFAEKLRSGWLNQTVAGELAKPSTPPELFQQLLARDQPLRVADVKRARRQTLQARDEHHIVDNPNNPGSLLSLGAASQELILADQGSLAVLLDEVVASLEAIAGQAHALPAGARTRQALSRITKATALIRSRVPAGE